VYIWNLWIFAHELIAHRRLPFSTDHLFAATGPPDFSLHNYAPLAGALGAPLVDAIGIVAAFNVLMLTAIATNGIATFALARRLGLSGAASWWAGALFMASPVLTAKEAAHFSLVIAAALPLFLLALLRALDRQRFRDAALVGAVAAAATYSDAYYGIYCALMGVVVVAFRFLRVDRPATPAPWPRALALANAGLAIVTVAMAVRAFTGPGRVAIGPLTLSLRTWYTPLLLLVVAAALRVWLVTRPRIRVDDPEGRLRRALPLGVLSVAICLLLLVPLLAGIALRYVNGELPDTRLYWRTSPAGIDALAYFVPNPTHAWFGERTRLWFIPPDPDAYPELVGSFSLAVTCLVAVGAWRRELPRMWVVFTAFFMALSLGPFIQVAGVNTYVIGPWALLRYVPVIGMARSPARFAVVAALGLALLAAFAIEHVRRHPGRRRWTAALLTLAAFELVPAPRLLHSAEIPQIYRRVAAVSAQDDTGRLLELPTGIRDGTSSLGDFSARSSYFQTGHRRPLVGGYLSRLSEWRKAESVKLPMFRALMVLSEGGVLSEGEASSARRAGDEFLRRSCTRFVMIDKRRASGNLQAFAIQNLRLTLVEQDAVYALYTPAAPPACEATRARRFSDISWLWGKRD
jgi:hypothetical protein